jgi:DNA-binding beta-propeller fold protein YncE
MKHPLIVSGVVACLGMSAPAQPTGEAKVFRNDGVQFWHSFRAVGMVNPSGIAPTSDFAAFYIADYDSDRIYVFDTAGGCLFDFGHAGLFAPTGVAFAPDDAVVYVCSEGTNDVQVFDAVGSFLFAFTGDGLSQPSDVAVTSDGAAVYVASRGTADIKVFDAVGSFLFAFSAPGLDPTLDPTGVALTSDDAVVYVANGRAAGGAIEVFTAVGQYLGSVAALDTPSDVTLDIDDAVLYAVSTGGNAVEVFDNQGTALLTMAGVAPLNGRSQLAMSIEDASFAVTNFGRLPRRGDLNCDGSVDFDDINPFVLALVGPAAYQAAYPQCDIRNGDVNEDCAVDFDDINPFVACLVGGQCP